MGLIRYHCAIAVKKRADGTAGRNPRGDTPPTKRTTGFVEPLWFVLLALYKRILDVKLSTFILELWAFQKIPSSCSTDELLGIGLALGRRGRNRTSYPEVIQVWSGKSLTNSLRNMVLFADFVPPTRSWGWANHPQFR
ncbi:MAG: hypothetical protein JNN12_09820 [Bacteroidetes Order II. Incertae sedis bacterium]|nr:hypothetical protein [Bacteroidetes Order II. bacterium]